MYVRAYFKLNPDQGRNSNLCYDDRNANMTFTVFNKFTNERNYFSR